MLGARAARSGCGARDLRHADRWSSSRSERSPQQRSYTLRVRPTAVDLDAIARLDELVQDVLDAALDADGGAGRLDEIQADPLGPALAAAARRIRARGRRARPRPRRRLARRRSPRRSSAFSSARSRSPASRTARAGADGRSARRRRGQLLRSRCSSSSACDASPDVVTLAALVTFLPGMTLTIGMRELATEHLQSGVANTASALVQLLGLVFGVGDRPLDRGELVRHGAGQSARRELRRRAPGRGASPPGSRSR